MNAEIYEGSFSYSIIDDEGQEKTIEVKFQMQLKVIDGQFTGTRIDEETKDKIEETISVKGFFDEDLISFVISYPYNYYLSHDLIELVLLKDEVHPGVVYIGHYNNESTYYEGTWNIDLEEKPIGLFQGTSEIKSLEGTWKMKKIKS